MYYEESKIEQNKLRTGYYAYKREERKGRYYEDSKETFVPKDGSRWSKYKTQWWYNIIFFILIFIHL